ncbi:MAG TPA: hypothetical protein PLI31_00595 [Methanoregulaceae archaeon]|nr:hypothetical protein [Methanoregulaceae archaeon]
MIAGRRSVALMAFSVLLSVMVPGVSAQTTSLELVRYGWDNTTVAESTTVNVSWMKANLPVMGDEVTHYHFQGPTFIPTDLWNPAEDVNLDKINETVKGTALRDLCEVVGGMHPGDEVQVRAADGFKKRLNYTNVYTPPSRQGEPILAWWNARNGDEWRDGMRLFFLADTSSNPKGWHIFGNEDMRICLSPSYWHYFSDSETNYPSAAGLSISNVVKLEIFRSPNPLPLPPQQVIPRDLDRDGKCEDVNGNGRRDFADVVLYFNQMIWIAENEPIPAFDFNNNNRIDFADIVRLFEMM